MNWQTLSALHELYEKGQTVKRKSLLEDVMVNFLLRQTRELREGVKVLAANASFASYYEKTHLANYVAYRQFLMECGLLKPQLRFQEQDIRILMEMKAGMETGELVPVREEMIKAEETVRGVSQMFFRNEKHLEKSDSLVAAVKSILGIPELSNDKDQQYKYVLQSYRPRTIVLCENLDFLKRPSKPRKHHIELWYAGGKNIEKLNYVGDISLPIYYSADWDHDGLLIYQAVRKRIPQIRLLFPNGPMKSITETQHHSHWLFPGRPDLLSGLDVSLYSERERMLIAELISSDRWIIEESSDLITMVDSTHPMHL